MHQVWEHTLVFDKVGSDAPSKPGGHACQRGLGDYTMASPMPYSKLVYTPCMQ